MIKPKSKTKAEKEECRQWIEVTETIEQQTNKNKDDIQDIKHSIDTIKDNHLYHIEKDMAKQSKAIEKLDSRIWWVLGILVVSTVIGMMEHGIS
tara:strand:+ start:353 stop:634 length:282 start_codon:yes stop_codon:yes gene_type:complete